MAKVYVKVTGGQVKEVEVSSVKDARNALGLDSNYTAVMNGQGTSDEDAVTADSMIVFSPKVKGGSL